jgi:PAS domain S-box-containing protein
MIQRLTFVSPRDNDLLTLRRGEALALVILLFMVVETGLTAISIADRDAGAQIDSALGWVVFFVVYFINRSGRVRLATNILMLVGTLITISGAIVAARPIPTLFFLGLIVVVAAAFGRPQTPLLWALGLSGVPVVINLAVYGAPFAPSAQVQLPDGRVLPSIASQELHSLALLWMLAGTAYLSSRLLNQMLDESRSATAQAIASNQKLRRSEERFAKIFQSSPIGIGISSVVSDQFVEVNEAFLQTLGYRRDEVVGRTARELNLWERPDEPRLISETFRTQRQLRNLESRLRTRSGALRDALISIELIELGDELCLLAMINDITERKRAEAALRESEERYRLIAENTNELIALFDADWRYVYASPSYRQMLGYDPAAVIGTAAPDYIHPDDLASLVGLRFRLTPADHLQATLRFQHANGAWHWLEASIAQLSWQGNTYTLSVARDVTERRSLEQQLIQAQKMETIGRLAGGVAHDFNNLLTTIAGYADLVIDDLPPEHAARDDLEELRKATDRAANLTRQLLTFARKQKIEPRVFSLNQLIGDLRKLIGRLAGDQIERIFRLDPQLWSVRADPGQIEQVLINLIVNARDAMPHGGLLTIETSNYTIDRAYATSHIGLAPGDYVLLTVSDTGVGMSAAVLEHVFEPFFTTKELGKGTGLGLATCYGIIQQHGGAIVPNSQPGQGTAMQVYLPQSNAEAPLLDLPSPSVYPRGHERILLVEDEEPVRTLAARVLRSQGYQVTEAIDGMDALSIVSAAPAAQFELLVTDMMMPQIDGRALAAQIAARYPQIKILMISGYDADAALSGPHDRPEADFLAKPFSPASLARKVREVLDGAPRS